MRFDRLVLPEQRHLKWRALDPLENLLMILCGVAITGFCVLVLADIVTRALGRPWLWVQEATMTFFIYGIFCGVAAATRLPVAFALMASVLAVTMFTPVSQASMIAQLFNGMDVEALLAVPFFLLVGDLMTSAKVTVRMITLSQALVGHLRGGLAQVVTLFSMFFAGISGSSAADVAVLTRTIAPEMNREGYDKSFTAALIASAATMANLIPPSIMAVVYGATGNVSIGGLFLGGVVPGILVGIGLMIYSHFFGPIGVRRRRATLGEFSTATKEAAVPLMIPIIIMGGILTGQFTPTEAGIIAVAYIVFIAIPIINFRHLRHLPRDMAMTGLLYSIPLITIGAASMFGWMLAYLRGPATVSDWISQAAGGDPFMIMLLLVLLFIIVGDFIDAIPAIIIFMPLIIDLTKNADINPVHMGVVIIVTLAFGLITPPYGLCLLMSAKFVGIKFSKAMLASLPIYVVFFAAIAFTIFFPEVVLWLPRKLLPQSVGCFANPSGSGYICP
jgi:C4-dicarboxylate transporter, DctM subunit